MEMGGGPGRVDFRGWRGIARGGRFAAGGGIGAGLGIGVLTLYSFSSDNWQRPAPEVKALMSLFQSYLRMETGRCIKEGVRIRMIGRRTAGAVAAKGAGGG